MVDCSASVPNACSDGIIGFCVEGVPQWRVCDDESVCGATWQTNGAYSCSPPNHDAPDTWGPDGAEETVGDTSPDRQAVILATVEILHETNRDGWVSPGESGTLRIRIRNTGSGEIRDVTGRLETRTSGVTIRGPQFSFGTLRSQAERCGSTAFGGDNCTEELLQYRPSFVVDSSVPDESTIEFSLALEDASDTDLGTLRFNYTLAPIDQAFAITSVTLLADTNNDGSVSPGETGRLQLRIRNLGTSDARGITGRLSTAATGVTINGALFGFGDVASQAERCGSTVSGGDNCTEPLLAYRPAFFVTSSVPSGTIVDFALLLEDAYDNVFSLTFEYEVK